jgi:hypothetical protein
MIFRLYYRYLLNMMKNLFSLLVIFGILANVALSLPAPDNENGGRFERSPDIVEDEVSSTSSSTVVDEEDEEEEEGFAHETTLSLLRAAGAGEPCISKCHFSTWGHL